MRTLQTDRRTDTHLNILTDRQTDRQSSLHSNEEQNDDSVRQEELVTPNYMYAYITD